MNPDNYTQDMARRLARLDTRCRELERENAALREGTDRLREDCARRDGDIRFLVDRIDRLHAYIAEAARLESERRRAAGGEKTREPERACGNR